MPVAPSVAGSAILTIDLNAVIANFQHVRRRVSPAKVAAVIKADGYGLGAIAVARALRLAGCKCFFVAELQEAADLVPMLTQDCEVYVLNGLQPGTEGMCAQVGAIPVLNSLDQVRRWSALAATHHSRLRAALQVDSGMARLGLSAGEVERICADRSLLAPVETVLLMSHFACADEVRASVNERQVAAFRAIAARFNPIRLSLANSGGAWLGRDTHFDVVRAGILLYGGAPRAGLEKLMSPVVKLEAPIIQLRNLPAGAGVGYGLTGAADRERRIATVALGYADGWPRRLGNRGSAYIGAIRTPIVGRISMDSLTIDVSSVPEDAITPGSMVEFLGAHQGVEDVARDADTISYEILTQLGRRFQRRYIPYVPAARQTGMLT